MMNNYTEQSYKTAYLSSAYLPPVAYFGKLLHYKACVIEQYEHYTKQSYRNRCHIAGPGGMLPLSIPTIHTGQAKCIMKDTRISDHGNWRHLHWNAIESAYNNTPFFEYYKDDFAPFYEKRYEFLVDFNEELRQLVCALIDFEPAVSFTESYHTVFRPHECDFREAIHPKKALETSDPEFVSVPYYQVFEARHGFLPNLSIIDLLFNMGPESLIVLRKVRRAFKKG